MNWSRPEAAHDAGHQRRIGAGQSFYGITEVAGRLFEATTEPIGNRLDPSDIAF